MDSIRDFKAPFLNPRRIANLTLNMDKKVIISDRRVYSILDFLGDIGGLYDAVTMIAAFFISSFANDLFVVWVLKTLFQIAKTAPAPESLLNNNPGKQSVGSPQSTIKRQPFDFRFKHLIQKKVCF